MDELNTHVRVLAISPNEGETAVLARILGHSAWTFVAARDLASARCILESDRFHVVLSDQKLPDGTWRNVLQTLSTFPDPAQLIVISPNADDRLWAEVLNMGAWDVLVKPFHPKEVYRTIHQAWWHWTDVSRRNHIALPTRQKPASETRESTAPVAGVRIG